MIRKKLKPWQRWLCVVIAAVLLFFLWQGVKSAPPNAFFKNTSPEDVTGLSFMLIGGEFGKTDVLLQVQTADQAAINTFLTHLRQVKFHYQSDSASGPIGESLMIYVDTDGNGSVMLALTKWIKADGSRAVTISYQGNRYFLERFSEEKELALYDYLYSFGSEMTGG